MHDLEENLGYLCIIMFYKEVGTAVMVKFTKVGRKQKNTKGSDQQLGHAMRYDGFLRDSIHRSRVMTNRGERCCR